MAVDGERYIQPSHIIRKASPPGARLSMKSMRRHGEGLVICYTIRFALGDDGWSEREHHVAIINSKGEFAGSLKIQ